jgi:phosphate-selective porin OprO/OprP
MFKRQWRKFLGLLFLGGTAAALLGGGSAYAADKDDLSALQQQLEAQKQQLEQQKQMLDELQKKLGQVTQPTLTPADPIPGLPPAPVPVAPPAASPEKDTIEKIVSDYLKKKDEEKKAKDEKEKAEKEAEKLAKEEEGFKVGSDLSMSVRWNPLNGVTFQTPNKDFVSHIGVRFQMDSSWWHQTPATRTASQLTDFQDGVFFRRIRPSWDGQAWEVVEWNCELALEQITNDVINLDQFYVGVMNIPILGRVWVGHLKTAQGLEGDTTGSSKSMTFLERSMYTDAFYENFGTGVLFGNSILDQRVTYAAEWYRQDNGQNGLNQYNNGVDFSDGAYAYSARVTALPIWENEGRCFLHLGGSYTFRDSERPNAPAGSQGGVGPERLVEFRARPQLRDAIGDYGGTNGNNATPLGLPGNARRIVDTGALQANSNQVIGTEAFLVRGPLSFMAEWAWACMDNAHVITAAPPGTAGVNTTHLFRALRNGTSVGTPWFDGGYFQVGYFLTGENRTYDRRLGTVGSTYIASPYTPFWLTKGEHDNWLIGRGAWELAARWNYLDLNNGDIGGGKSQAVEVGVNWFLNTNLKFQFMYLWQDRYHLAPTQVPGNVQGFAVRTQFFF